MKVSILDLQRQYKIIQKEVEQAVCAQMASGMYVMGSAVLKFEQEFADFIGVKHAIAVNSGTDSLVISLRALGIKPGDEVITTPFTFFATAEPIAAVGAIPVFVDIEEKTYNIDISKIEDKITAKTKAIIPVHIFGHPVNMNELKRIADKYNLKIIEDCCQAVGATFADQCVGSFGDCGCFSFFPTKNLGAFGDGGMITTNDDDIAIICRALREHGMAQNGAIARSLMEGVEDELVGTSSPDGLYNPYKYYNYLIAYNSRLDAIQAVILSIKLKYVKDFNKERAKIAAFYEEKLNGLSGIITPKTDDNVSAVWHQYALRSDKKDELGTFLADKEIGSAAFYPVPLHLQKAFDYLGYKEGDLPISEKIARETVCLPIFPELTIEEMNYITESIEAFVC